MSDIAPIRAAVALAAGGATGGASTTPPLATTAGSAIPAAIAQLAIGAVVSGVVIERGARGLVTIRTDKGTLTLQTPVALRLGSTVSLQIQSLGAQSQFMILSVDGQPLASQTHASALHGSAPHDTATAAKAPGAPASGLPPTTADGTASKLPPATDSAGRSSAPPPIAMPAVLRPGIVLTALLTPLTASPVKPTTPPPAGSIPMVGSALTQSVAAPGGEIAVRVLAVASPVPRAPTALAHPEIPPVRIVAEIPASSDAVTFRATVADATANDVAGTTLLRTPLGLLRLPIPPSTPPGSQILLELLTRPDAAPRADAAGDLGPATRRLMSLAQEWPALREIVGALEKSDPQAAQQVLAVSVPRVGPTLAAGLLFFIAAMRSGGVRNWIGDRAIEILDRSGQGALLARLSDDMANLPRLAETQPNGWQTLLLPIFDGEKLRQIRMSMRRSRQDGNGERKEGTRFIIEAELTRLGPFQLDGLVRRPQFDLAVRTRDNLPPEVRANIVEIFNDALQATRLTGAVVFQISRDGRPGPSENWQASGLGLTV